MVDISYYSKYHTYFGNDSVNYPRENTSRFVSIYRECNALAAQIFRYLIIFFEKCFFRFSLERFFFRVNFYVVFLSFW